MRVGNIAFLPQGYGVLRNKSETIVSLILMNCIYACSEFCA